MRASSGVLICRHSLVGGGPINGTICQAKPGRPAKLGVAGAALFGHFDETEVGQFPDCGGDRVTIHPAFDELVERDGQLAIVAATVVRQFDFDPGQNAVRVNAEHPVSR